MRRDELEQMNKMIVRVSELETKNYELIAVLEKIADLHRGPGSALARSALDTMRLLESKPRDA